jgi:hypothetical protein
MPIKTFKILFARTSVGTDGAPLSTALRASRALGPNWPMKRSGGAAYQLRDLQLVGRVWRGTFAHLRDDAPNVVGRANNERELDLEPDDHLIDKCHFLYREIDDVLVWQVNRMAGGFAAAERYLSDTLERVVTLPMLVNAGRLQEVLAGDLYEIHFAYARPADFDNMASPRWAQDAMDMINNIDAARAKFMLRGARGDRLGQRAKMMISELVSEHGVSKIKVRLTDETDMIDIITAPLKDSFRIELIGRYPPANQVYSELEAAYDRQRESIPPREVGAP